MAFKLRIDFTFLNGFLKIKTIGIYCSTWKLEWDSNFSVHKVLPEQSHPSVRTASVTAIAKAELSRKRWGPYGPQSPEDLLSGSWQSAVPWHKRRTNEGTPVRWLLWLNRPVATWPGAELGWVGTRTESRAGSGHDVSNQQGAWMESKVTSGIISGFGFEQLGRGLLSPPEREDSGQMLEGWGAREHSSGERSWRPAGYTWAGNGGCDKSLPVSPLYTEFHKSLLRCQIWTLLPQQMNEYFEQPCGDSVYQPDVQLWPQQQHIHITMFV